MSCVLVVDDEALVLEVTATMLEDLGQHVITASSAGDALHKLAAEQRIDILVTDICMPGMDGIALAKAATRMRDDLKIIIVSANTEFRHDFQFIRKPFGFDDMRRALASV